MNAIFSGNRCPKEKWRREVAKYIGLDYNEMIGIRPATPAELKPFQQTNLSTAVSKGFPNTSERPQEDAAIDQAVERIKKASQERHKPARPDQDLVDGIMSHVLFIKQFGPPEALEFIRDFVHYLHIKYEREHLSKRRA